MKQLKFYLLVFIIVILAGTTGLMASEIMPLSEVKEGMIGTGKTVFRGDRIEEFQVEILGVLHNFFPQHSMILAQLKGGNLDQTGVIAGMSGSPVFVNGKMIGAVAYSWPFAKTPIAGITPIESMMEAEVLPSEQVPIKPPVEISQYYNFESLITNHFSDASKVETSVAGLGNIELTPIATPLMVSGFDPKLVERFRPLFASFGMQPMQAGVAGQTNAAAQPLDFEPGSPISVQLVRGDLDIGAIGTVTYRDKEKILAFGHPFFNLGPIDFPMATAQIFAVVPSLMSSFKIGSGGPIVGSVKQDFRSAVYGVIGEKSAMIPVKVTLHDGAQKKREFNFEVVDHNLLAPLLLDFAFQNTILATQLGYGDSTLKIAGAIGLKHSSTIQFNNIFSGMASFSNASQYLASVLYTLMSNEFRRVDVDKVEINVDLSNKRKEAELQEVWLDRTEVHPGDVLNLKALYKTFQGSNHVEEFDLKIPDDLDAPVLYFIVGSGQEISRLEYAQYGKAYKPDSLDQIVSLLNNLRSNDRIYVKTFLSEPTLVMKGRSLYKLPTSAYSILSSSQTIGSSQKVNSLVLSEDSHPIDYFLTGTKYFAVKVLPRQN
jgi:hypothetical protein